MEIAFAADAENDFVDRSLAEVVETSAPMVVVAVAALGSGKMDDAEVKVVAYPRIVGAAAVEGLTDMIAVDAVGFE